MANVEQADEFKKLGCLGIYAPEQLLLHLPKGFVDCTKVCTAVERPFGEPVEQIYQVTVASRPDIKSFSPPRLSFTVTDDEGSFIKLTVFGFIQPWKELQVGQVIYARAKPGMWRDELQLDARELVDPSVIGRVAPVYRGKAGVVSTEYVEKKVQSYLPYLSDTVEYVKNHFDGSTDESIVQAARITSFRRMSEILYALHHPQSMDQATGALDAAHKIAAYEAVWMARKNASRKPNARSVIHISDRMVQSLIQRLPYTLNQEQLAAIHEIIADLTRPYSMYRLLCGDVGTGKTLVYGVVVAAARAAGAKVAILVPNLLLVRQTFNHLSKWWPKMPVQQVISNTKLDLAGDPVLVGTTALFSRLKKAGWIPDLLIVDEQSKFAVSQREHLLGEHTNMLEATATCVPRSMALVLNGGMDMTTLTESPVEKKIHSHVVRRDGRAKLFAHLKKVVEAGGQIAVIYPHVKMDKKAAEAQERAKSENKRYAGARASTSADNSSEVWEKAFPGRVGVIHGKMKDAEKLEIVTQLENKSLDVIASTLLLEAGLTLPSLRALVVVNASRFGIAQLHQLRGRVAREGGIGYFFMYEPEDSIDEDSLARLSAVEKETSGFRLAELDMEIRGFGDLSEDGELQSGNLRSSIFTNIRIRPADIRALL